MSLTVALSAAQAGLSLNEKKIAITAGNINNADREGYTRKTLQSDYISLGLVTLPVGGSVVQAVSDGCQGLPGAAVARSAGIKHQCAEPVLAEGHPDAGSHDRVNPVLGLAESSGRDVCAHQNGVKVSPEAPQADTEIHRDIRLLMHPVGNITA
jgi:hypothetical protein